MSGTSGRMISWQMLLNSRRRSIFRMRRSKELKMRKSLKDLVFIEKSSRKRGLDTDRYKDKE